MMLIMMSRRIINTIISTVTKIDWVCIIARQGTEKVHLHYVITFHKTLVEEKSVLILYVREPQRV